MDIFDVLTMIGGLSLFLFGMNLMGEALERAAGNSLRTLLGKLTTSRMLGFFTGMAAGRSHDGALTVVAPVGDDAVAEIIEIIQHQLGFGIAIGFPDDGAVHAGDVVGDTVGEEHDTAVDRNESGGGDGAAAQQDKLTAIDLNVAQVDQMHAGRNRQPAAFDDMQIGRASCRERV